LENLTETPILKVEKFRGWALCIRTQDETFWKFPNTPSAATSF